MNVYPNFILYCPIWVKWHGNICTSCCREFMSFLKIGAGKAVLFSWTSIKLHLRLYHETMWHFERKKCRHKVCMLRGGVGLHHLQSFWEQNMVWLSRLVRRWMWNGRHFPVSRRNLLPPSSGSKPTLWRENLKIDVKVTRNLRTQEYGLSFRGSKPLGCLLLGCEYPGDGGSRFACKVVTSCSGTRFHNPEDHNRHVIGLVKLGSLVVSGEVRTALGNQTHILRSIT
jgi:hypothetical protein